MASIDLGQVRDKITGLNKSGSSAPGTTDTYTMTTELNPSGLAQTISVYNGRDGDYVSYYLGDYSEDGNNVMFNEAASYFYNGGQVRPYGQTCYATVNDDYGEYWFLTGNQTRLIYIEDGVIHFAFKSGNVWTTSTALSARKSETAAIPVAGLYAVSYDNGTASQTFMLSVYDMSKRTWSENNTGDMAMYDPSTNRITVVLGGAGGTVATPTRVYLVTRYIS